jgi:serine/threonine protein kinase
MEEKIGAGNFSIVYRAIEKTTQNEVAVKVIEKFKLSAA